jgi:hypothetical protein
MGVGAPAESRPYNCQRHSRHQAGQIQVRRLLTTACNGIQGLVKIVPFVTCQEASYLRQRIPTRVLVFTKPVYPTFSHVCCTCIGERGIIRPGPLSIHREGRLNVCQTRPAASHRPIDRIDTPPGRGPLSLLPGDSRPFKSANGGWLSPDRQICQFPCFGQRGISRRGTRRNRPGGLAQNLANQAGRKPRAMASRAARQTGKMGLRESLDTRQVDTHKWTETD